MAKPRYVEWLESDGLLKLEAWARDGLTDEQISHNMGIAPCTLYKWKNEQTEIAKALKRGKEVVDIEVENALLKKAKGFVTTVKKAIKVKNVEYENGRRIREYEEVVLAEEEVFVAPDTTAQIFWLKNRRPSLWRDKREQDINGNVGFNLVVDDDELLE